MQVKNKKWLYLASYLIIIVSPGHSHLPLLRFNSSYGVSPVLDIIESKESVSTIVYRLLVGSNVLVSTTSILRTSSK